MVEFEKLVGSFSPGRIGEYSEMLRLTCESPGPPHQILTFCHNRIAGEMPESLIEDFADAREPATLNEMAESFEERYCGARSSTESLDSREMRKLMESLWSRLQCSLCDATKDDPNWQNDHEDILELYGNRPCGETLFRDYDSGTLGSRVAAWNKKAARAIGKQKPKTDGEVLNAIHSADLRPFEIVFYLKRSIFKATYRAIITDAATPLRTLAQNGAAEYAQRQVDSEVVGQYFSRLYEALGRPVDDFDWAEDVYQDYEAVRGRAVGDTTLKDYEMFRLSGDINNWTHSIRKSLQNRYFGASEQKRATMKEHVKTQSRAGG